jgi:hypothetical protein
VIIRRDTVSTRCWSAVPRSVAKRFELSESAVYRHKTEHLPTQLLKAKEVEEAARADDLLDQVRRVCRLMPSTFWIVRRRLET